MTTTWIRWQKSSRRCLYGAPEFSRWHVVAAELTGCGYRIPTGIATETTSTVPPWKSICTRCRREDRDGVTGQLQLALTEEKP
jgi:hypothetical protein